MSAQPMFDLDLYGGLSREQAHARVRRDGLELHGACANAPELKTNPDVMFPDTKGKKVTAASKAICRRCPLAALEVCREDYMDEEHGTRGGMTEWERETYRATRRMREYRDRQKNAATASAA